MSSAPTPSHSSAQARRVLVVGFGRRVREAALPALEACQGLELAAIAARSSRSEGGHEIRALDDIGDLEGIDIVYLAVGKEATPPVLAKLAALGASHVELLIETPVLRFKHLHHLRHLRAFRRVSVSEDCAYLPWFEVVRAQAAELGGPRRLTLDRSAYAYHGLATAKALLGASRVRRARRRPLGPGRHERRIHFAGKRSARILEPRDYTQGCWTLECERGCISQDPQADLRLEPILEADRVRGFRIGEQATHLSPLESALTAGDPPGSTVIARQAAMKRVGFLRIWQALARGEEGYPLDDALDDMVIDYHLEKFGHYLANPLTSSRSPLARTFLGTLTRLGGG